MGNFQPQFVQNLGLPSNPVPIAQPSNEATLWIGNLSPSTNEDRIHAFILNYSEIQKKPMQIKVMKDLYNGESRRFGFISFNSLEDAEIAKRVLNYARLDSFEIRLYFKKLNTEFNQSANLFIGNIQKTVSTKKLDEMFSECGKIVSCSIRNNDKGESLGYGYVQFESEESAKAAIEKFNLNKEIGEPLKVEKFVAAKNRVVIKNNVYIRNFPVAFTEEQVKQFLITEGNKIGKVVSTGCNKKELPTKPPSFAGFVAFENEEMAQQFIEKQNNHKLPEHSQEEEGLLVAICETRKTRLYKMKNKFMNSINNTNLLIKSLIDTVTEEQLREIFAKFGEITSICLKVSSPAFLPNGQSLKCAFINFKTAEEASDALMKAKKDNEIRKLIHPIHKKGVDFICFHQTKSVRNEFLRMRQKHFSSLNNVMSMMNPNQIQNFPFFMKKGMPMVPQMPMMPPMGFMPNNMMGPNKFNMNRDYQGQSKTPQTDKNSQSGSTSRHGEEEEVFTVETLKSRKNELMKFEKEKQQNILGNIMYHKVMESSLADKKLAPKITGMLIDLDILEINEIIEIMENKDILEERIEEAMEVIHTTDE